VHLLSVKRDSGSISPGDGIIFIIRLRGTTQQTSVAHMARIGGNRRQMVDIGWRRCTLRWRRAVGGVWRVAWGEDHSAVSIWRRRAVSLRIIKRHTIAIWRKHHLARPRRDHRRANQHTADIAGLYPAAHSRRHRVPSFTIMYLGTSLFKNERGG